MTPEGTKIERLNTSLEGAELFGPPKIRAQLRLCLSLHIIEVLQKLGVIPSLPSSSGFSLFSGQPTN